MRVKNGLPGQNVAVAVYGSSAAAVEIVRQLGQSGFDMSKVSIAGREHHVEGTVVGFYCTRDRIQYADKSHEFWVPLWGVLSGWAYFLIPGFGSLLALGPLGGWIASALDNVNVFGGLSAFGAGLYSVGIPKDDVPQYEAALKTGSFLVVAHGTLDEVGRGREILRGGMQGRR